MARDLKLGLNTGYWSGGPPAGIGGTIAEAERLGFDSLWTAEAYGSDVLTPLAWWGSKTQRMRLGTAIVQLSARTPAATAMAAMTMDHLSGGRFILGLGVSGPQVVEGWYGQPFAKPLARTREYIAILRDIFARQAPVTAAGPHYPLPYPDGTGFGKPLKSTLHPLRDSIPIFLGAEGPKNVALCAELCDGWLPLFFSPHHESFYRDALAGERQRVVRTLVGDRRLAGQHLADDVHDLAGADQRLGERLPVPALHDLRAAHTHAQDDPAAGEVVEGERVHRDAGRRPA